MAWRAVFGGAMLLAGGLGPVVEARSGLPGAFFLARSVEEQRAEAIQLSSEAERLRLYGEWQAAIEKDKQALAIIEKTAHHKDRGIILNSIGLTYKELGQQEIALSYFQQALKLQQEISDLFGKGTSLNNIGGIYNAWGQHKIALAYFQKSLEIRQEVGDLEGESISLNNLGKIHRSLGNHRVALNYFRRSLNIGRETYNRKVESISLDSIGYIYEIWGKYEKSLEYYHQSLEVREADHNHRDKRISFSNIGGIYYKLGQYKKALTYYRRSLALKQRIKDRWGESSSLSNIGEIYYSLGQYKRSLDYYYRSLEIQKDLKDRHGKGGNLKNIGETYHALGQYGNALGYFQRSLAIRQEINDRRGEGASLNSIGNVYSSLGQHDKALGYLQNSLLIRREISDRQGEGVSLNNIGTVYRSLGQYTKSLKYLQQSLSIQREIGDRQGEGISLNNIGTVYSNLNQYEKAIIYFKQSLAIEKSLGNRLGEGIALNNLGNTHRKLEHHEEALEYFQKSLALQRGVGDRQGEGISFNNIAHTFSTWNQPQLAILFFKQSVSTYETIRADLRQLPLAQQKSYTKTIESTYRALADLLLQQDRILEAQQVLDLLKVQELEDYLRNTRSSDSNDLIILKPEQEILDRYQQLQTSAIQIGQELTQLRQLKTQQTLTPQQDQRLQELLNLETDINRQFNRFIDSNPIQALLDQLSRKTLQRTLPLEDLNALRDNLRKTNAALIYPLILGDRLELILTTPDSPPIRRTVTHFDPDQLKQTIVAYRSALQSPNDLEGTQQLAQQLYDWLIAPLETDLAAANPDTLIYAPDGILRYIPLAALYDENQPEGKRWLAQRYATNNIVAKSLTEFDSAPADNPRVLAAAWGNQTHSIKAGDKTFNFSGIPFTLSEVQSLAQLLPTEALLEQDFSRSNLTAKDLNSFNIIHLATHGKFVTGDAANSFLALGSGEAIPLPDIKNLSLSDVDLVVLSACETGVGGDFGQGEEILGLGYQFQRAGAKAALASLWQVDDGGTQQLMNAFYAGLNQGMTKAEALQAAQQALISSDYEAVGVERAGVEVVSTRTGEVIGDRQLSHPYYWAPFILIGNGL